VSVKSSGTQPQSRWLRRYGERPGATARLVCLPHAGGAPTFFRDWTHRMSPGVEVSAVCYPGRQDRFAEPCITEMAEMAGQVAEALAPLGNRPLALFGHSMGATVAFEAARLLRSDHGVTLSCLFVSGAVPPHRVPRGSRHREGDEALIADIREQGATEWAMLADTEFREFLMPAIRADYQLMETYELVGGNDEVLDTPIVAYYGEGDSDAAHGGIEEWGRFTRWPLEVRAFPGGHFYLRDAESELLADIVRRMVGDGQEIIGR
jgi:pyochelin biosynthetic protein PchC